MPLKARTAPSAEPRTGPDVVVTSSCMTGTLPRPAGGTRMTSRVMDATARPSQPGPVPPSRPLLEAPMTAYALAHLRSVDLNAEVEQYLRAIDDTLPPYGGAFLVHGSVPEVLEGDAPGALVLIGFPDLERARAWYDSAAYQAILPLRTRNSEGFAVLLDGVPDGYRAASFADGLARA